MNESVIDSLRGALSIMPTTRDLYPNQTWILHFSHELDRKRGWCISVADALWCKAEQLSQMQSEISVLLLSWLQG